MSGKQAWALAEYETVEQAQAVVEACAFKPLFPGGPSMRLDYHHIRSTPKTEADDNPPSKTLFVGGIKSLTNDDLYEVFSAHSPNQARTGMS